MNLEKPLNKYIDHTLLNPNATHEEFEKFLDDAVEYQFTAVCVSPYMAAPVKSALRGEDIKVCTVVGFPHGTLPLELKLQEIRHFADRGIDEVDFVFNRGDLHSERYDAVGHELESIDRACKELGLISKCIVEACDLTDIELRFMLKAINDYTDIDYIKTSTGFGSEGAKLIDVMNCKAELYRDDTSGNSLSDLMYQTTIQLKVLSTRHTPLKIKAAGGIHNLDTALKFIAAGADRLGMSSSSAVMREYREQKAASAEGEGTP